MSKALDHPSSLYQPVINVSERYARHARAPLREARWWSKLIPFAILIPTVVSLSVGALHLRHYKNSSTLYVWSVHSRALVQVIVHVLSSLLAILWVVPLCTSITHLTRRHLAERDIKLDTLRLWSAMTLAKTDWNLPRSSALLALGFCLLTYVPATLWAGALSPSLTYQTLKDIPLLGKQKKLLFRNTS
jgi:hypothetical protein